MKRTMAWPMLVAETRNRGTGKELGMSVLVVYESVYGNTRAIAEAVAEGLGGAEVTAVHAAPQRPEGVDLLVVGGPTHMHGLATIRSRQMGADAVKEDGDSHVEPGATEEPGLRAWLAALPDGEGRKAAAFDTRLDRSPWLTGVASRGIAKRLRRHGYEIVDRDSFLVEESEGPVAAGELERAREWGRTLAGLVPVGVAAGVSPHGG
jgi:Flavodoxin domain